MNTLRTGSSGPDVQKLQQRLTDLGYSLGVVDGIFGQGTAAAVMAFQRSQGLQADGLAGPQTLAALGLNDDPSVPSPIPAVTVENVAPLFPSTPRANIQRHLPTVLNGLVEAELGVKPMVLMALATIRAETEGFVPISEGQSRFNTSPGGNPFDLYDRRTDLGNNQPGDGALFRGRGFIQLTGRANYQQHGQAIGLGDGLLTQPEQANDPVIAAKLLASFLKAKETAIMNALGANNLALARKLVNGGSNGLDRFTDCYTRGDTSLPAF